MVCMTRESYGRGVTGTVTRGFYAAILMPTSASTLAVVAPIEAGVVQRAVDADPVGLVDASAVAARGGPPGSPHHLFSALPFPPRPPAPFPPPRGDPDPAGG